MRGTSVDLGLTFFGLLIVTLPFVLLALALRTLVAPWRPDPRLREPHPFDRQERGGP